MSIYTSYSDDVEGQLLKAIDAGLNAGATVYQTAMAETLNLGYTSGDHVTGTSKNAVKVLAPADDGEGRAILVGTSLLYNLFWELGWTPAIGKIAGLAGAAIVAPIYRVEKWRPTLVDRQAAIYAAFVREFGFVMLKAA